MEARNWIGLTLVILGLILLPVGWMYEFWLQVTSLALFCVGVAVFATQKILDKKVEQEFGERRGGSRVPTDIHGSSGWDNGGRSDSWKAEHGGEGD